MVSSSQPRRRQELAREPTSEVDKPAQEVLASLPMSATSVQSLSRSPCQRGGRLYSPSRAVPPKSELTSFPPSFPVLADETHMFFSNGTDVPPLCDTKTDKPTSSVLSRSS